MDEFYNARQRAEEKQASRDRDAAALASGSRSREDLWHENSAFAFPDVLIDLDGAESLV